MDLYSHMASPSIPNIFSPLSHHVQGMLAASPHPSHSSYRRQSSSLLHHSLSGAAAPASVREEDVSLLEDQQQDEDEVVVVEEDREEQEQERKQARKRAQRLAGPSKEEAQGQAEQLALPQLRLRHHAGKGGQGAAPKGAAHGGHAAAGGAGDGDVVDGYGDSSAALAKAGAGSWEAGVAQDEAEEDEDVFYEVPSGSSFVQAMLNGEWMKSRCAPQ